MSAAAPDPALVRERVIGAAMRYMTKANGLDMDAATAQKTCEHLRKLPPWVFVLHATQVEIGELASTQVQSTRTAKTHLLHALRAAKRAGVESLITNIQTLLKSEELNFPTAVGRRRKLGAFHTALAVDYGLERGGMGAGVRARVLRESLSEAGLNQGEITTSIKRVADYRRSQVTESKVGAEHPD